MTPRDFKYLIVWLLPVFAWCGLSLGSWYSPGSFYLAFVLVPILDFLFPQSHKNFSEEAKSVRTEINFFDALLYLNLPILYILLFYFIRSAANGFPSLTEHAMQILNIGIVLGVMGINVAHELGHRSSFWAKATAQLLLLPCLYMHFTKEHNHWHHKYVASDKDPSSARLNEALYTFWFRSISGVWRNAWILEKRTLEACGLPFLHWRNTLILQVMMQIFYLSAVYFYGGSELLISCVLAALVSILLLETINYIEHYGLSRAISAQGHLEAVHEKHSWNSDHPLGRIFLYELTRHPHHHKKASEKYQNLDSIRKSPQMAFGYPASMIVALIPPLWYKLMNSRIDAVN